MATPHRMFSIGDVLGAISEHLDKVESIGNVRLTCRAFEIAASPYLFATLRLGFHKRYLRRLRRVAADKKFAEGVRELSWDTSYYRAMGKTYDEVHLVDMLRRSGYDWEHILQSNPGERHAGLARLKALYRDENELMGRVGLENEIADALSKFTGLKAVSFTGWPLERRFFDR